MCVLWYPLSLILFTLLSTSQRTCLSQISGTCKHKVATLPYNVNWLTDFYSSTYLITLSMNSS